MFNGLLRNYENTNMREIWLKNSEIFWKNLTIPDCQTLFLGSKLHFMWYKRGRGWKLPLKTCFQRILQREMLKPKPFSNKSCWSSNFWWKMIWPVLWLTTFLACKLQTMFPHINMLIYTWLLKSSPNLWYNNVIRMRARSLFIQYYIAIYKKQF